MNQNPGIGSEADDILENIPSDSERRAATDAGHGRRGVGFLFRRPFRPRSQQRGGDGGEDEEIASLSSDLDLASHQSSQFAGQGAGQYSGEQSAGEEPEERRVTVADIKKAKGEDIYNISASEDEEPINPLSNDYNGIVANYFSVGLMIGGSTSLLYPVLIVQAGATASLMSASYAVVMVFWSYKIIFGFLSDCFPIGGYKRKPYIVIGVSIH